MKKWRSRRKYSSERGAVSSTNDLRSLLNDNPDYTPIFTDNDTLPADFMPLEFRDRRVSVPNVDRSYRAARSSSPLSSKARYYGQRPVLSPLPPVAYNIAKLYVCTKRKMRKEVLHAIGIDEVNRRKAGNGGARSSRKDDWRSKIKC